LHISHRCGEKTALVLGAVQHYIPIIEFRGRDQPDRCRLGKENEMNIARAYNNWVKYRQTVTELGRMTNRELADLDREIFASNARVIREARNAGEAKALQREQDEFIARRNADFGRPGYDLKKAMQERLQRLNGVDGY